MPPRLLNRFAQRAAQQRDDAVAVRGFRFVGALEHAQRDAFAEIDQCRKRSQTSRADERVRNLVEIEFVDLLARQLGIGATRESGARAV